MFKNLTILSAIVFFLISTVLSSFAGSRYYSSGYRNHHHSRYHVNRYYNHYNHSYDSSYIWAGLGIGLLTGVVVGTIFSEPVRQQTVVYTTPPPATVYAEPVYVREEFIPSVSQTDIILRRVETTPHLLNVRSGPGFDTTITGQVLQGSILDVIGAAPEWLYVKTPAGQLGWVLTEFTIETEAPVG